ncbi:futalosine hydrolase [Streptomyces sp. TRM 70361]|uniref:futalosine hydrolase n=1 Tax=Streptomyces sp. TRM 70361 TaxID=3116553 RepID=UPI002E7AF86C|nr:futalosine hydrolase [Streptomyces sp. TRM 70361]MEE1938301.1 futalosine hydrolase [Streptomyces sp. TRM 70361]
MRTLVVTAVPAERDAVAAVCAAAGIAVLAAGVGPAAAAAGTALALARAERGRRGSREAQEAREAPYGLVVSAGIGGGFAPLAPVGTPVVASEIVAADLGAETPGGPEPFTSVAELGFGTAVHRPPPELARAVAEAAGAAYGPVLTVSTATGTAGRAALLARRHPGAVAEAMEGFGVAQAAALCGAAVLEVRAVSNPVGPRDRAAWRIPAALEALAEAFGRIVPVLDGWSERVPGAV